MLVNPANWDLVILNNPKFDPILLEQIHDLYYPAIHRYIDFRLSDSLIVDQTTRQVFVHLAEAIHKRPKSIGNLQVWLFDSAARLVDQQLDHHPQEEFDNNPDPDQKDHSQEDESIWLRHLVRTALHQLPNEYQHILALRFCETRSVDEVARLSGLPMNDVKTIQYIALVSLRELLEKEA